MHYIQYWISKFNNSTFFHKAFVVIDKKVLLMISWMNIDCIRLSFWWWNNGKSIVFLLCLIQKSLQTRLNAFWIALEKSFSYKFWSKWIRCNAIGDTHSDLNAICRYGCTQWSFLNCVRKRKTDMIQFSFIFHWNSNHNFDVDIDSKIELSFITIHDTNHCIEAWETLNILLTTKIYSAEALYNIWRKQLFTSHGSIRCYAEEI